MSAEKRITKRLMKEDRLVSTTFKATEYIQKNQTAFIIGGIAVVVIFSAILLIKMNASRKVSESYALLFQSEMVAAGGQMDQYMADLALLADNYSGTTAAKIATLRLANTYFDQTNYDKSESYYTILTKKYSSDKMVATIGAAGIAACYEAKGNFAEAAKYYSQAAAYKSGDLWTPAYLLRAGQNYAKAGDKKSAEAAYDQIEKQYANSSETSTAKRYRAELAD
jgi:predicted negative regulator of RcsB-dependent stress response